MSFISAVKTLFRRVPKPSYLTSAEWAALPAQKRRESFYSATIASSRVLQSARNLITNFLEDTIDPQTGGYKVQNREDFRQMAREMMVKEGIITPEQADSGSSDITDLASNERLNLIFDTQVAMARDFSQWQNWVSSEAFINQFPAARFERLPGATRKRQRHVEAENEVRRWDDFAFWTYQNGEDIGGFGNPYGPFGYNSYMKQTPVTRAEAERLGVIRPGEKIRPIDVRQWGGTQKITTVQPDDFNGLDAETKAAGAAAIRKYLGIS